MKKIEITAHTGHTVTVEFTSGQNCADTLLEAVAVHGLHTSGHKELTFIARPPHSVTIDEVYSLCSAVQAVFGTPLEWEITPQDEPSDIDALLFLTTTK